MRALPWCRDRYSSSGNTGTLVKENKTEGKAK